MTPERWQQIDKILELALERASSQRGAFLDQACAGDEELRREVESLLEVNIRADGFLGKPALEQVARDLARDKPASLVGRQLAHYQILCLLGEGGMGVVWSTVDSSTPWTSFLFC